MFDISLSVRAESILRAELENYLKDAEYHNEEIEVSDLIDIFFNAISFDYQR